MSHTPIDPELQLQTSAVLDKLQQAESYLKVSLDSHELELSHLSKPMWSATPEHPEQANLSKRDLLTYYCRMAPNLLPYLHDRPLTIKRFPEGVDGPAFMQRHIEELPQFVETVQICTDATGNNEPFILCQNLASLLWLVNQGAIEFHPWHSRINPEKTGLPTIFINSTGTLEMSVLNYPDWLLFDIDPHIIEGEAADETFSRTKKAVNLIHRLLDELQLAHRLKLTGQRGMHIYIPLIRQYPFDQVRQAAKRLSERLAEQHDTIFTTEWHIERRQGKVFLDWQQNARGKSVVAPYSVRASQQANVASPLDWSELEVAQPDKTTLESVTRQLTKLPAHFWEDLSSQAQALPDDLLA